ncbi:MAG TPA: phosphatidylinositol kinase [Acidimicrobiia bacterium]|nr:phosphatidylinositol kinase [Acidimicrobiia bacterium]
MPPLSAANGSGGASLPFKQRSPRLKETLRLEEVVGEFVSASNLTLLATDSAGKRWVYKATEAMSPLWDFDAKTLPARELATYLVSEALGFGVVPETVWSKGPLGTGSAQRFIDVDPDFNPRPLFVPEVSEKLWPVAVLDVVCNNADRKLGHLLTEKQTGRIFAIDNGLTFHSEPKLRTVLWGLAEKPLPEAMIHALDRLGRALDRQLAKDLMTLVTKPELEAFRQRLDDLASTGVHPLPPEDRPPVPWPVW